MRDFREKTGKSVILFPDFRALYFKRLILICSFHTLSFAKTCSQATSLQSHIIGIAVLPGGGEGWGGVAKFPFIYDNEKSGFRQNISLSSGNTGLSPEKRLTVPTETVKCLLPKHLTIPRETVKRCRANS